MAIALRPQIFDITSPYVYVHDSTVIWPCFWRSVCGQCRIERRIPDIEPFDGVRTLPEGERLKLICRAAGSPRPVLYWYRDGRPLDEEPSHHSRYLPGLCACDAICSALSLLIENIAGRLDDSLSFICLNRCPKSVCLRAPFVPILGWVGSRARFLSLSTVFLTFCGRDLLSTVCIRRVTVT